MTKPELIDLVAQRSRLSRPQAARALDAAFATIAETLAADGAVSLAGFGRFHVGRRAARAAAHPRTGEPIWIGETRVPRFTAGAALKRAARG